MIWVIRYKGSYKNLKGYYLTRMSSTGILDLSSDVHKALTFPTKVSAKLTMVTESKLLPPEDYEIMELGEKKKSKKKNEKQKFCIVMFEGGECMGYPHIENNGEEKFEGCIKKNPELPVFEDYDKAVRCLFDLQSIRISDGKYESLLRFELRFYPPPEDESEGGGSGDEDEDGEDEDESESNEGDDDGNEEDDERGETNDEFGQINIESGVWGIREIHKDNRRISTMLDKVFSSESDAAKYIIENNFLTDEWFTYDVEKIKPEKGKK